MSSTTILSSLTAGTTNGSEKGKHREKKEVEKPLKKKLKNETKGTQVRVLWICCWVLGVVRRKQAVEEGEKARQCCQG